MYTTCVSTAWGTVPLSPAGLGPGSSVRRQLQTAGWWKISEQRTQKESQVWETRSAESEVGVWPAEFASRLPVLRKIEITGRDREGWCIVYVGSGGADYSIDRAVYAVNCHDTLRGEAVIVLASTANTVVNVKMGAPLDGSLDILQIRLRERLKITGSWSWRTIFDLVLPSATIGDGILTESSAVRCEIRDKLCQ